MLTSHKTHTIHKHLNTYVYACYTNMHKCTHKHTCIHYTHAPYIQMHKHTLNISSRPWPKHATLESCKLSIFACTQENSFGKYTLSSHITTITQLSSPTIMMDYTCRYICTHLPSSNITWNIQLSNLHNNDATCDTTVTQLMNHIVMQTTHTHIVTTTHTTCTVTDTW